MAQSRRSFLSHSGAFGFLSALAANSALAEAVTGPAELTAEPTVGETYWKNLYAGEAERGRSGTTPDPNRDPRIAHYSDKAGLRWAEDIQASELPVFRDDAVLTMELAAFRAGSEDKARLTKVRFAQLHLSCQRVTGSAFLGPLVWASLASLTTNKSGKSSSQPSFSWGALTGASGESQSAGNPRLSHIVLNQGAGHLSVNITTTPPASLLDRVLSAMVVSTKVLTPLLGFPGIALPALQNFYSFYGQLEKSRAENFLLNGSQRDVAVTQQGANNDLISANALKLITGTYVLIPKAQEDEFQKQMDKLLIRDGFLAERNSKADPDERIAEAVPAVTYVALNVRVQAASTFPATSTITDPLLDAAPPDSGAGGQAGGKGSGGKHSGAKGAK